MLSSANQTDGHKLNHTLRLRLRLQNQTAQDEQELSFNVTAHISAVPVAARCTIDTDYKKITLDEEATFVITARGLEGISLSHESGTFAGATRPSVSSLMSIWPILLRSSPSTLQ
jgi:hypothetical protein